MTPHQLERITGLHDRLFERALSDADPTNWVACDLKPNAMSAQQRGDAQWCRKLAIATVALTMAVRRLMENPVTGGAAVPTDTKPQVDDGETVEAEINRYEKAAGEVLARARTKR